ncbi:thrB [Symbiodinium sp. KB8]|nr:thrB [Symbiodinium sp. KB8]
MTPLTYAVPPDTNRWGYTLTYHPPQPDRGAVQAAHHTPNQQPPGAYQQPAQPTNTQQAGMAQQHQQNGPSTGQQPGGPPTTDPQHQQPQAERPPPRHDRQPQQPHQAPPTQETEPTQCLQARANNNNNQQDTTPEATNPRGCSAGQGDPEQEAAAEPRHAPQLPQQRQEDEPTCNRNPQPPSTAKQPEQPIRNRWGRYLQPLSPHASPPEQATTTETGEATDPEAPPDTGSTPPTDAQPTTAEQGNQGYARMGHPGHQPLQRTTSKHEPTSGEVQQAADDSDTQQLHIPQEVDTQTAGHHPQQPQQHNRGGTEAAASSSGDQYQAPELEEVGDKPSSSGQASQPKPYHEGRGDQRMRGKRFKAAVQTAFGQRGWTKSDSETWKGVAHLVGMSEEDEEEEPITFPPEIPTALPWRRARAEPLSTTIRAVASAEQDYEGDRMGGPVKWLLHITSGPSQPDENAAEMLPRTYTMPPSQWEEMGARLIPPPQSTRQPAGNPTFDTYQDEASPGAAPSSSPTPSPQMAGTDRETEEGQQRHQPPEDEDEDEGVQFMQRAAASSGAASSHGPRVLDTRVVQRMSNAAAMIRKWLRELAVVLRERTPGDTVFVLLEEAMQTVSRNQEAEQTEDGTVGAIGPCKKRRILNMLSISRMRLTDVASDEGEYGYNQHQIYQDLKVARGDLDRGTVQFQQAMAGQGGYQVQHGRHGLEQARAAIEVAMGATAEGDLDWMTPGWAEAVALAMQEAEELLEESSQLDYVHPADVVALHEGAEEAPAAPEGDFDTRVDLLLRNVQAVAHFVQYGREGSQPQRGAPTDSRWVPPLSADQWTGSIPTTDDSQGEREEEFGGPTDEDLIQAPEEYERQEQEEARLAALGEDAAESGGEAGANASERGEQEAAAVKEVSTGTMVGIGAALLVVMIVLNYLIGGSDASVVSDIATDERAPQTWRMFMTVMMLSMYLLNYADRYNISVAILELAEERSYSKSMQGFIQSAVYVGIIPSSLFVGYLASPGVFGAYWTLLLGCTFWSLCTLLTPICGDTSLALLILIRVGLGAGEAVAGPCIAPITAEAFIRSLPAGEGYLASIGQILCLAAGASHETNIGLARQGFLRPLHASFHELPVQVARLWSLVFAFYGADSPKAHRYISDAERRSVEMLKRREPPSLAPLPFAQLLRHPSVQGLIVAEFFTSFVWYLWLSWMPTFFHDNFGMSTGEAGTMGLIAYWLAAPAALSWAELSGQCLKSGRWTLRQCRLYMEAVAALISGVPALLLLALYLRSPTELSVALVVLTVVLVSAKGSGHSSNLVDVGGISNTARVAGLVTLSASFSGAVGNMIVGALLDSKFGWPSVLSAAAGAGVIAFAAFASCSMWVKNEEELLQIATNIEGHPDNVAPCIYGGFQLGIHNGKRWWTDRVTMPHGLMCVVFCPDHATETSEARLLLKEQIALQDAIFNCGRVAVLVAAFATGNMDWLRYGTEDALHQEQRAQAPQTRPYLGSFLN